MMAKKKNDNLTYDELKALIEGKYDQMRERQEGKFCIDYKPQRRIGEYSDGGELADCTPQSEREEGKARDNILESAKRDKYLERASKQMLEKLFRNSRKH